MTKTLPTDAILTAWAAGQREFGENRPEEGAEKIPMIADALSGGLPTWHMIGHVQQRKCPLVIKHFGIVHSVDRGALGERLSRLAMEAGRSLPVLLECNVSGESSKYGYAVTGWEHEPGTRDAFYEAVLRLTRLPGLQIQGLMTIAPMVADPEQARPVFASLRRLRDAVCEHIPELAWPHLSMGMSDDFEVAIEEGATMVRVGRAIFGERR